ncbi:pyridoxamine 5'-phosphate oxidase family protein [Rhodococcus sp. HNM0569]|uniref:pyridoxamine 5'-phosphate oxidase family protein n=1 Tax=Rhodococcus sp. HNM0569 TaxID=2716340 RepID=UPI00146DE470|nr:pyridoxamine 5'-phosphate oxidase family protein [Rhodococcus sp. HNM0569]NLU84847.1 pyridoxamine 5'-phosphate oxidase family protein [Rhodococcus sp. HNM0569]
MMSNSYPGIAFRGPTAERQRVAGSYSTYGVQAENSDADGAPTPLDVREKSFVAGVDSFFLATVTPTGWPYIQHRGGPRGFLHVLDSHTIGFADFAGNRQYVTAGNIDGDDRVALFLVDYPLRRRLKIFGRARQCTPDDDPRLAEQLLSLGDRVIRSRIDRLVTIEVHGFDWNCTSHITPRYDKQRLDEALALEREEIAALRESIAELEAENARLHSELGRRAPDADSSR